MGWGAWPETIWLQTRINIHLLLLGILLSSCSVSVIQSHPKLSFENARGTLVSVGDPMWVVPTVLKARGSEIINCKIKIPTPAFPSWAQVNPKTCVISGTPDAALPPTLYQLIATSKAGDSETATVILTAHANTPILSFLGASGTAGDLSIPMTVTPTRLNGRGSTITQCAVKAGTQALPSWATLHPTTCVISGTPDALLSPTSYSMVASNAVGDSIEATVALSVGAHAPTLSYSGASGSSGTFGSLMTLTPTTLSSNGAGITNCRIKSGTPALPSWATLHSTTCVISGIPNASQPVAAYTVIASNAIGDSADAPVSIRVAAIAPTLFMSGGGSSIGTVGVLIGFNPITLLPNGSPITQCRIKPGTPDLPSWANLDSLTCVISGTPDAPLSATTFTLIASNVIGDSADATLRFEVTSAGDPNLTLSIASFDFGEVPIGSTSGNQRFTFANLGTGAATGCSAPTLSNAAGISIIDTTCTQSTLPAGSSCSVTLRGNPVASGRVTTTLSLSCSQGGTLSTDPDGISVTGVNGTPVLSWAKDSLKFGAVLTGKSSHNVKAYFRNSGTATATNCQAPFLSPGVALNSFFITDDQCSTNNLGPGEACEVTLHTVNPAPWPLYPSGTQTLSRTCAAGSFEESTTSTLPNGLTTIGIASSTPSRIEASSTSFHTCVVSDSTTVQCWGDNRYGQLGDGSTNSSNVPVNSNVSHAVEVAVGQSHTCALLDDGNVKCWGQNQFGQVGVDDLGMHPTPVIVQGIHNAVGITAGDRHTCVNLSTQEVKCWGYNQQLQLGVDLGGSAFSVNPVTVPSVNSILISAGANHTCSREVNHTLKCWGSNDSGQIGNGSAGAGLTSSPYLVNLSEDVLSIATGGSHTCAVLKDTHTVYCWGAGTRGQLGNHAFQDQNSPVLVDSVGLGIAPIDRVVAGLNHTCGWHNSQLFCWGENHDGQLGDHTLTSRAAPVLVQGLPPILQKFTAGNSHTCAISAEGVFCWGSNYYGQLGDGTTPSQENASLPVEGVSNAIGVSLGDSHTCILLSDGQVQCLGSNSFGQLGNKSETFEPSVTPVFVNDLSHVTAVSSGLFHSCALDEMGMVFCWGSNSHGQLGVDPSTLDFSSSVRPVDLGGIATAIASGVNTSCAILENKSVKCWGANESGQLGLDPSTQSYQHHPVEALEPGSALAISVGGDSVCAILSDSKVDCWGNGNSDRSIDGNSSRTKVTLDDPAPALPNPVIALSSGMSQSCAVLLDSRIKCWETTQGANFEGIEVPRISNAAAVSVEKNHACAILLDGKIKCWGGNESSQLGDLTTQNSQTPVYTFLNASVKPESLGTGSGAGHTCAVMQDGVVHCWGNNLNSQCGIDELRMRTVSGL